MNSATVSRPSLPQRAASTRRGPVLDRLGATASTLCAVHCAMLPFMAGLLPMLGLGLLASEGFEQGFIAVALCVGLLSLVPGYRRHRQRLPLLWLSAATLLFALGLFTELHHSLLAHTLLVVSAGLMLAWAHIVNLRMLRRAESSHCCPAC